MAAIVFAAAGATALAQDAPGAAGAAPPTAVPPTAVPASDRRGDIKTLEAVLTMAVKAGADKLALQMRASEPGSLFVTDTGRTRGFDLHGYGVFFDVDVPMMKQSVLWTTSQLLQQDRRVQLENYIATQPSGAARDFAIRELRRMQQQGMRQPIPAPPLATPVANGQRLVSAASTDPPAATDALVAPAMSAMPAGVIEPTDPNELYTQAVKSSLIDAMLKYSVGLKLGAAEWLTVAARDAQGPLMPGALDDASTIVIRIKGGDLAAFHSGKLTRDEVMKRVEVKEF